MTKLSFTYAKNSVVSATLAFLLVAPFAPLAAQAATTDTGTGVTVSNVTTTAPAGALGTTDIQSNGSSDVVVPNVTAGATPAATPPGGDSVPSTGCSLAPGTWDLCITNVVYAFTVGIGSGFAYVSAYFFDWAIALSLNGSAYALDFVSQGWTTARDLANMAFLFILLYIAFKIIFEAETTETVHMLTLVIVIALLVNFSFFFTRLAIDAGNLLSIQFYNAIQAPAVGAASGTPGVGATVVAAEVGAVGGTSSFSNSKDLTASIMGMLNLQGLFNTTSFTQFYSQQKGGTGFMVVLVSLSFLYIAAGIMFWLLTVAFITNGVKFLFRIVILWFLIIAAPLAFVCFAVPKFKSYYTQWQNALIAHAFYPAVFMFIFLMLANFCREMGTNNNFINGMFTGLSGSTASSPVASLGYAIANVGIRMGFVIAMLYIGMEASKKVGVMGADMANHAGDWVGGKMTGTYRRVGGAVGAGAPAWAMRNTVGWTGDKIYKSNWARNWAAKGGWGGRSVWRTAGTLGRQSYDARGGLAAMGVPEGAIGKAGGQGGYTAAYDARVKMREEESAKLKPSESKLVEAQEAVLKKLTPEQRQELLDLADNYAKKKEDRTTGDASTEDVKKAKKAFNDKVKELDLDKDMKAAREAAGSNNAKIYAGSIDTKGVHNMWGATQGTPLWIWAAEKEASAKIRGGSTEAERVRNILSGRFKLTAKPVPEVSVGAGGGGSAFTAKAGTADAILKYEKSMAEKMGATIGKGIARGVEKTLKSSPVWNGAGRSDTKLINTIREQDKFTRQTINKALAKSSHGTGAAETIRFSGGEAHKPGGTEPAEGGHEAAGEHGEKSNTV